MESETMIEVPEELNGRWLFTICPEGSHTLVVASKVCTPLLSLIDTFRAKPNHTPEMVNFYNDSHLLFRVALQAHAPSPSVFPKKPLRLRAD